jgi:hypothetical protein
MNPGCFTVKFERVNTEMFTVFQVMRLKLLCNLSLEDMKTHPSRLSGQARYSSLDEIDVNTYLVYA